MSIFRMPSLKQLEQQQQQQRQAPSPTAQATDDGDRSLTPRPDWPKIGQRTHLELGDLSTTAAVDVLVRALATRNMKIRLLEREDVLVAATAETQRRARQSYVGGSGPEYVEGLGLGESVPRYLRVGGRVRRRVLTKRQTELTVRDIWQTKKTYDRQRGTRSRLADYVYTYLSGKYGASSAVPEWGYGLVEALKAYGYDADIRLFEMVLHGEVSEDVYDDQGRIVQHLLEACAARDPARTGTLDRRSFVNVLLKLFPEKPKPNMRLLVKALERQAPGGAGSSGPVFYERLFEENRDGDQGPFAECLRDQHLSEIMAYYSEIKAALDGVAGAGQAADDGRVSGQQIREAIRSVEKRIPKKELDQIIEDVFEVPSSKAMRRQAGLGQIMNVIKSKRVHKRFTRPTEHDDDLLIDAQDDDGPGIGSASGVDPAPDENDSVHDGDDHDRELRSDADDDDVPEQR